MSYFDFINKNKEYLVGVDYCNDHIKGYVIFNMVFPHHWDIKEDHINSNEYTIEHKNLPGSKESNTQHISFIATPCTKTSIDCIENAINLIIEHNTIKDEKTNLLHNKIQELESLFDSNTLEDLQDLEFIINEVKPTLDKPVNRYLYKIAYYLVIFNEPKLQKAINFYEKKFNPLTAKEWGKIYELSTKMKVKK